MGRGVKRVVEAERQRGERSRGILDHVERGGTREQEARERSRSKRERRGQAAPFIVDWANLPLPGNCGEKHTWPGNCGGGV